MSIRQKVKHADSYIQLVVFHIAMGALLFTFKPLAKVFFLVIMGYFLIKIVLSPPSKVTINVLLGCAYFAGAEVLFRMTKGGIAYEASKYLVILFTLMGMFYKGVSGKGYPYFIYLILLVPSIIIASATLTFDARFRTNIAFVLSGPVCLGIAALFCYNRRVTFKELNKLLAYMVLPIISTTTYLFLYNPSIKETLSGTASNLAASGGFGPNQVATILGLGIFIMVIRFLLNSTSLPLKILNLIILGGMTYRAIVTFSRGGVVASIIIILAFLGVLYVRSNIKTKFKLSFSIGFVLLIILGSWTISSNETNGLIDKRYANQNALGVEKKDVTTGRVDLFKEEIEGFLSSPFVGIGASRVKDRRVEAGKGHLPSHNEIGRLLSEHGFLGIIILMILLIKPLSLYLQNKNNIYFWSFFCFWFATINHSGLRIAAPSFVYALCLLSVKYEKNPIHRKQLN